MPKTSNFTRSTRLSFIEAAKKITSAARTLGSNFGPGLRMIGEEIMMDVKDSKPDHGVPVDTGTLRASGRVEGPSGTTHHPRVSLSFGSAAASYALIQHEVTTFKHKVGEPRYLVRGLERWRTTTSSAWRYLKSGAKAALTK